MISSYIFQDTAKFSSILGMLSNIAPHNLLYHCQSTAREKKKQEAFYIPSNRGKKTPAPLHLGTGVFLASETLFRTTYVLGRTGGERLPASTLTQERGVTQKW